MFQNKAVDGSDSDASAASLLLLLLLMVMTVMKGRENKQCSHISSHILQRACLFHIILVYLHCVKWIAMLY